MLAIEALQPRESLLVNSADDLKRYVDEVACPALGVCLDTGAMTRAGDTIEDYFTILGKSVIHAHFVDVDCSQMVTHLSWGDARAICPKTWLISLIMDTRVLFPLR